jgi:hypothetical protein
MPQRLRVGVGGVGSCISRFIHPSKPIRDKYVNRPKGHKLENLTVIAEGLKTVRRGGGPTNVFIFSHGDFPDVEFYAARRYLHITEEGPEDGLFDQEEEVAPVPRCRATREEVQARVGGVDSVDIPIPVPRNSNLSADDLADLRRQGIAVDDDNDPAPENVPARQAPQQAAAVVAPLEWRSEGIICPRRANNLQNSNACFKNYSREEVMKMTKLELFLVLFPTDYLTTVLIPETNKELTLPMDLGEFVRWLGCWFYMACWVGIPSRKDWWATSAESMYKGAPFRLGKYMSRNRFDEILSSLRYTNKEVDFPDGFFHMRQLEEAWNKNMADEFSPSWINVLDESMMEWFNKYAPGFMCVGRKPHPFGNERHTICCALTSILWRAQIVEGKDRPQQLGPKEHAQLGATVGLMLRMCEPIYGTGKAVVLDSGFCVAKGIVALEAKGVYAGALIKKRRYWPKSVPGGAIDEHFVGKEVGDVDMLEVKTEEGKPFRIYCFKEPDYVMKIMATWMTLDELDDAPTRREYKNADGQLVVKAFKYRMPFGLHFRYRHQVDDHNNRRHAPISLERTWATKFWPDRNFAWYLAASEVNAALASGHLQHGGNLLPSLEFRRALAKECLENTIGIDEGDIGRPRRHLAMPTRVECEMVTVKHFCGMWDSSSKKWKKTRQKYQKQRCSNHSNCNKMTRTYCKCTKGLFLCAGCFTDHKLDVLMNC